MHEMNAVLTDAGCAMTCAAWGILVLMAGPGEFNLPLQRRKPHARAVISHASIPERLDATIVGHSLCSPINSVFWCGAVIGRNLVSIVKILFEQQWHVLCP